MGHSGIVIADPQDGTGADVIAVAPVSDSGQAGVAVRVISSLAGSSGGGPATIADGADVAEGATTDAAVVTNTTGTISGKLRGLVAWAYTRMPAALGQTTMSASLPVVISSDQSALTVASHAVTNAGTFAVQAAATLAAETTKVIGTVNVAAAQAIAATQSGTWTVQPGNTANTTAWKVDGSAVTQPVSGTVAITQASPGTLIAFVTAVTTAGTRVNLASNAISAGILQAPSTNTGKIYVGTVAVSSTVYGAELQPGQSTGIAVSNTNLLYIDSTVNGDKCAFLGS